MLSAPNNLDRIWNVVPGHPFLTVPEAEHGVRMLYPLASLTIPFAIFTGVLFWISSVATGWAANYVALARLESAIANSLGIRRSIGSARANTLARWLKHHAAGSAGYIALGFLLGIPLEVRQVTLGTAGAVYALDALELSGQLHASEVLQDTAGILLVGAANILTSFALSFLLAVRARDIGDARGRRFLGEVGGKLLSHPLGFLLPGFRSS